jgi:hypothetical protein
MEARKEVISLVIKKIVPLSVGKLMGALYGFFGLLAGAGFSLLSLISGSLFESKTNGLFAVLGVASIVVLPLLYGAMGFIGGIIGASFYNFIAKFVGGVEIETESAVQ